jgi:predicted SprT family Zn-dependent metalloprotease
MNNRIPVKFNLFSQTIDVIYSDTEFIEHDDKVGFASYRKNEIVLRINPRCNEDQLAQTFYHELMHFIMYHAGSSLNRKIDYIHRDEEFIDLCGNLLHQAISTMKFKEDEDVKTKK